MVNFNFGLGGLMGGDDDKKDDAATPVGDDTSVAQDDSSTQQRDPVVDNSATSAVLTGNTDTSTPEVVEESSEAETLKTEEHTKEAANEPVFEETVKETAVESASDPPFVEAGKAETTTEENIDTGLTSQNSEESWLNDEKPIEPVVLETETPEIPTFGQPESASEVATEEVITEGTNDDASENLPETEPVETVEAVVPEIPTFGQPESTPEPVEKISADEIPTNVSEELNPFPEAAVPVTETSTEEVSTTSAEPFIPAVPKVQTEIPALEQSESIEENSAKDLFPSSVVSTAKTSMEDMATDSTDLFTTTPTEEDTAENLLKPSEETVSENDPLAPAATAVIGGDLASNDDDDDLVVEKNQQKLSTKIVNPVVVLEQFKEKATGFLEEHNRKIEEYNNKIAELKTKIRKEKHILKEEQKKSAKILEDLNSLVANFSKTIPIKKKVRKQVNKKKFTPKS